MAARRMTVQPALCLFAAAIASFQQAIPVDGAVVAFGSGGHGTFEGWQQWDWDVITHLAFWGKPPQDVRDQAAKTNTKLYGDGGVPTDPKDWTDKTKRKDWAQQMVQLVKDHELDGVFFDYEGNKLSNDEKKAYTELAAETTSALAAVNASLFICVGGSPTYEWRNYDYQGLADNSEFLFIMAYDMHFWDDYTCVTKGTCSPAEAPIKDVTLGVKGYLESVPPSKLVLALPWYGQLYQVDVGVPFNMGQLNYSTILSVIDSGIASKTYDKTADSWKIVCKGSCTHDHKGGVIWFDDAQSLIPKYAVAHDNKLLGIGIYRVDYLPTSSKHTQERDDMWQAVANWNK